MSKSSELSIGSTTVLNEAETLQQDAITVDKPSIPYIRSLDGLRGLAILLVLFDHWAPWKSVHYFEFGRAGLLLFFILSGYLITTVLLALRDKAESKGITISRAFKKFYMRRALRIFPLYLSAIIIAAYFIPGVRDHFIYHLLFIQNFSAMWGPFIPYYGFAYPLWSLAVEEQFYLVWAPVVLLMVGRIGRVSMIRICFAAMFISLVFRAWCATNHVYDATDTIPRWTMSWYHRLNTLGDMDSLAIGSLVAIDIRYKLVDWSQGIARRVYKAAMFLAVPFLIIIIAYTKMLGVNEARATEIYMFLHDSLMQVPLWLLLHHSLRTGGGKILNNDYMVWVGKKSYGLYVWHEFVHFVAVVLLIKIFNYQLVNSMLSFLLLLSTTFFVAAMSWRYIEAPFLRYKTKWD